MVLINGRPAASISVADRGLNYGDGVFETIALTSGALQHFDAHLERLDKGCRSLAIPAPSRVELRAEAHSLCSGRERGVLKLVVTRGEGGRGYRPAEPVRPNRILSLHPWPEIPRHVLEHGVETMLAGTRLGRNPELAGIKHLSRIEQVLAALELSAHKRFESLMCDCDDLIIEGTRTNVFFVQGDMLLTPSLDRCGVRGVMREQVVAAARELAIEIEVRDIAQDELAGFDDGFFTNSVLGMVPIRGIAMPVGVAYAPSRIREGIKARLRALHALPVSATPE